MITKEMIVAILMHHRTDYTMRADGIDWKCVCGEKKPLLENHRICDLETRRHWADKILEEMKKHESS
jgi:hypothetical protein